MRKFALVAAVAAFGPAAFAAGIDSRGYTCAALQSLVTTNRFVFVNTPGFGDFAVADRSVCSEAEFLMRRSVPTSDNPECLVNHCKTRGSFGGN